MSKVQIIKVSDWSGKKPPVPSAVLIDTGRKSNTGEPITHWAVEISTLKDLAKVSHATGVDRLIVTFNDDGTVSSITVYDDYK